MFDMPNPLSIQYFIDSDILQNSLIDIDIDIFMNVLIDIDNAIFRTGHIDIDIDIDIFQIVLRSISIFSKNSYRRY